MSNQAQPPRAIRRRILVVEDDETIARMLLKVLGTRYAVDYAGDGKQAVAIASKVLPHLIMLDVMMPGLDGFDDVLAKVKKTLGE